MAFLCLQRVVFLSFPIMSIVDLSKNIYIYIFDLPYLCNVHGQKNKTHLANAIQSEPLGIYPDLLHILDLAIYMDIFASAFLEWTDPGVDMFPGRSRDARLVQLYAVYLEWCVANRHSVSIM